ncbi:hypothetical protein A1O3_09439 [Capronia epimyces CBS 606.96]|uniref:Uncharacterized protein n=1 Tax=Capronia epimyces CBS 606.96 TaxID=1182542 RepID=W9XDH9_9EURO|nr:uncharacterized protein A1O3_09439 [Capronia epimyces CBS 606.96]EXJ78278.1 hypothetical protein A1O3_09439 [Capronia epimyces CBS 606.96]
MSSNPYLNRDTTTLDGKLIGKMIHVDCSEHHCSEQHTRGESEVSKPSSISNPRNGDVPAPEYLHCGFWPRPLTEADLDEESHEPRGLHDHHGLGAGRSGPAASTSSLRPTGPDGGEDDASGSWQEVIHKAEDHHSAVTDELSKAVDAWRTMFAASSETGEGRNDSEKAKKPYSVMRLVARQPINDRNSAGLEQTGPSRQSILDKEIAAECQARSEIMEYIDALVDEGDYEDAYACIWPLEEYRRSGWAEEMIFAFPNECWGFVDMVRAREKAK